MPCYSPINHPLILTSNISAMKIQKAVLICSLATAGLLFVSCKKDTPKQEQKTTVQEQKATQLAPGEVRVDFIQAGNLETILKDTDREKLTKLVVSSGMLNQADLDYITKSLKIQELDLTSATLSLKDNEKGFYNNSTLKKIIAPANLEKTQQAWFSNTLATEFIFPGDKLHFFGGASYNEKLKSIILPNSVEELGEKAFEGGNFETITLSSKLKTIPAETFKSCRNLTKITIPASITEVGSLAFKGCNKLKSIIFLCPAPKFSTNSDEENAFADYNYSEIEPTIIVPKDTKATYLTALGIGPRGKLAKLITEAE